MDASEESVRRFDALAPHLDQILRGLAARRLRGAGPFISLQTSDLVQEAWIRLIADRGADPNDELHFREAAASAIRRVILDHAKRRAALKRGGGAQRVQLVTDLVEQRDGVFGVLALDEAIEDLAELDPLLARLVVVRVYGGLTREQSATRLELPLPEIDRHWKFVKRWLERRFGEGPG